MKITNKRLLIIARFMYNYMMIMDRMEIPSNQQNVKTLDNIITLDYWNGILTIGCSRDGVPFVWYRNENNDLEMMVNYNNFKTVSKVYYCRYSWYDYPLENYYTWTEETEKKVINIIKGENNNNDKINN